MIRRLFSLIAMSVAAASAVAADIDYTTGVIFINEDWYGHQNSTVNYLLPDAPDGEYWNYRVIQTENPEWNSAAPTSTAPFGTAGCI